MKRFAKAALALLLALALCIPVWAAGPAESDIYYEQLSAYAKGIYDAMNREDVMECLRSGESYSLNFNGPFDSFSQGAQMIFDANSYALSAFELNHPEFFWLNGSSDSVSGNSDRITLTVTPGFSYNWHDGGRSTAEDEAAATATAQRLAEEARAQGGIYEQLCYVHDWLTANNEYNSVAAATGSAYDYLPWTPLSALTDGLQPVCEGYAKAFKMVCDELGIPCVTVDGVASGGGHEWNQVLLNGQWYGVDVTFDDPTVSGITGNCSGYEMHDFFLVGSDTVVKNGRTFSETHTANGSRIAGTSFTFPALSDDAFDPGAPYEDPYEDPWEDPYEDPYEDPWEDPYEDPYEDPWEDPYGDPYEDPWEDPYEDPYDEPEPEYIRFADVSDIAYYAPAVQWAVICGVTNGTKLNDENGLNWFSPEMTVTRGQAVTFLWRAMWCPEPETEENTFSDVAAGSYYEQAVLWAVENGITNGTGGGKFSPDDPVTRGQMLTFLWRTVGRPGDTGDPVWYADAENWAAEFGIADGTAEPYATGADCPRSDVVYYLYHAILSMAG